MRIMWKRLSFQKRYHVMQVSCDACFMWCRFHVMQVWRGASFHCMQDHVMKTVVYGCLFKGTAEISHNCGCPFKRGSCENGCRCKAVQKISPELRLSLQGSARNFPRTAVVRARQCKKIPQNCRCLCKAVQRNSQNYGCLAGHCKKFPRAADVLSKASNLTWPCWLCLKTVSTFHWNLKYHGQHACVSFRTLHHLSTWK